MEQIELTLRHSDTDQSTNSKSHSLGLIYVLLRLGLATVPIPPSVPSALDTSAASQPGPPVSGAGPVGGPVPSVANTPGTTNTATATPFVAPNPGHHHRFPAPVNYSGFPLHPGDPFGGSPAGGIPPAPGVAMRKFHFV